MSAVTLLRRRAATALGSYGATALGIVGTIVAANVLGVDDFGRLALVLATVALFQLLLDLTSEEALVKYGFRYAEREDWGASVGCSSSRSGSRARARSSRG